MLFLVHQIRKNSKIIRVEVFVRSNLFPQYIGQLSFSSIFKKHLELIQIGRHYAFFLDDLFYDRVDRFPVFSLIIVLDNHEQLMKAPSEFFVFNHVFAAKIADYGLKITRVLLQFLAV